MTQRNEQHVTQGDFSFFTILPYAKLHKPMSIRDYSAMRNPVFVNPEKTVRTHAFFENVDLWRFSECNQAMITLKRKAYDYRPPQCIIADYKAKSPNMTPIRIISHDKDIGICGIERANLRNNKKSFIIELIN